jgi:hypothetical protein
MKHKALRVRRIYQPPASTRHADTTHAVVEWRRNPRNYTVLYWATSQADAAQFARKMIKMDPDFLLDAKIAYAEDVDRYLFNAAGAVWTPDGYTLKRGPWKRFADRFVDWATFAHPAVFYPAAILVGLGIGFAERIV